MEKGTFWGVVSLLITSIGTLLSTYLGYRHKAGQSKQQDLYKYESLYAKMQQELLAEVASLSADKLEASKEIVSLREDVGELRLVVRDLISVLTSNGLDIPPSVETALGKNLISQEPPELKTTSTTTTTQQTTKKS